MEKNKQTNKNPKQRNEQTKMYRDLKCILLSYRSQIEKAIECMTPAI